MQLRASKFFALPDLSGPLHSVFKVLSLPITLKLFFRSQYFPVTVLEGHTPFALFSICIIPKEKH